ncbi:hypothetical protein BASA81_003923 [Batrachochytrium salamandrivorans]|nr:hypothetical protein BASA81_003923 [Batrachochytrium salamandrivorans]
MHGNSGSRVKHLANTESCPHHTPNSLLVKGQCATANCTLPATQFAIVIMANQNDTDGKRFVIYLCNNCHTTRPPNRVRMLRDDCEMIHLAECKCGVREY